MSALNNPVPAATAEKEMLLALLRESREKFLNSFAGLSDEQSRSKSEGSWSVLDTVEHLTVAEKTMVRLITTGRRPKSPGTPNREDLFLHALTDRSRKLQSPEGARPTGRFASLAEAAAQFNAARQKALEFVCSTNEDLRATEVTHPHPAAGTVSTCEMLIVMAKHAERHALQIEEIKATLGMATQSYKADHGRR